MHIENIHLINFRNYDNIKINTSPGTTVIYGKNGSGKTNLLEAIHFSCFARSQRTRQDHELIRIGENFARINIIVSRKDMRHNIDIQMKYDGRLSKIATIWDKRVERIADIFGHNACVLFAPEDMYIIKGGPSYRRRFMDMQISQINNKYLYILSDYQKALKNRNALLKTQDNDEIEIWEDILAKKSVYIINSRMEFIEKLNNNAVDIYKNISSREFENLNLSYNTNIKSKDIYLYLKENLKKNRYMDIKRGITSLGPHRDDIDIRLNDMIMQDYSSQGQIRSAVLSLKLSMINILDEAYGEKPVLLLDDVFSELDSIRRNKLTHYIKDIQTFITCTDKEDIKNQDISAFLRVENNGISKIYKA